MHKAVTVGTSAVPVLEANRNRQRATFYNNGANDIFIAPGPGPNTSSSIPVKANGGFVSDSPDENGYIYTGVWTAISGVAAQTLGVTELDRASS